MSDRSPVRYTIDRNDTLVEVGGAWSDFLAANDGAELAPDRVLGRRLWDWVADPTTIHLYQTMTTRVRRGAPPLNLCVRCDAPERRRLLDLSMRAREGGAIEFVVTPVEEQARPRLSLLDRRVARDERLLSACSWCNRLRAPDGRWVEAEEAVRAWDLFAGSPVPGLTHGICEVCHDALTRGLESDTDHTVELGRW